MGGRGSEVMTLEKHKPFHCIRRLGRDPSGQSLVEIAMIAPLLTLLVAYAVDFGYFFIVAATLTSAAKNSVQYSIQGGLSATQAHVPVAGPLTTTTSVSALAVSALSSLVNASTTATIQVCSKANGTSGNSTVCSSYGPSGTSYTPDVDPEAPRFFLQRVDITYTVKPPVPMSFFSVSLMPNLSFHRQVSMRAID